jgi:hypothetical protein
MEEYVPDYLVWSILATLLCCLPVGIVAVVYSAQVSTRLKLGDMAGARDSSKKARMWCWITFASFFAAASLAGIIGSVASR